MIKPKINNLSALLLSLLLILTAFGNAYAFFVFGALSLCFGFLLYRGEAKRIFLIAVTVSSFVAVLAAVLILLFK